jgi:transposase
MTPNTTAQNESLFMAMELSNKNWKLAFSNGEKVRFINVVAGDQNGLRLAIERSKGKLGLAADCRTFSCYEAGRDGFWIHRCLAGLGVENLVVDPASIEINRRKRHLKTDRIDAEKLVRMLMRYHLHNEKTVWRVVVIPSESQEDERRLHREGERLKNERVRHLNRIRSLLVLHGARPRKIAATDNSRLRDWQGAALPAALQEELRREQIRLELLDQQIKAVDTEQRNAVKKPVTLCDQKAAKLAKLKGIGAMSASVLSREVFGWRTFKNRREVGAMAGLTGTAYASGDKTVEQGISKAGNKRVRYLMIELAWMWTWYQPDSDLAKWFMQRFGAGGKRSRRIGIVALARKLLVALWKYVEFNEVPAGAIVAA